MAGIDPPPIRAAWFGVYTDDRMAPAARYTTIVGVPDPVSEPSHPHAYSEKGNQCPA